MKKNVLITRVEDDEITRYCSRWVEIKIKPAGEEKGFNIIDLHKEKAVRVQVESVVKSMKPPLMLFHGHGDDHVISGYKQEILIHVKENAFLLSDAIVHSLTCSSANVLGRKAVEEHKTLAFIGYEYPFVALTDDYSVTKPLSDETARPFLESAMKVAESLLKGNTSGESFKKSQDLYNYWIEYYRINDHIKDASDILQYLISDRDAQVLLGDTNAQIQV